MLNKMKIIYMGTPDFAVPCLRGLIDAGHEILLVVTQPDKPVGRKQILTPPPVKELALQHGIEVYQPEKLKTDEAYEKLASYDADFFVVAAYGKILPKRILDLPKYACVNVHGSLLPKYRGAAPIQWAVINGEEYAGVTTMLMGEGLDTGDMLLRYETKIGENETAGELFDRLAESSPDLLLETLEKYAKGEIVPEKQNDDEATYAPMLDKQLAEIDSSKDAKTIFSLIKGMNPWPVANTVIGGVRMKIFSASISDKTSDKPSGTAFNDKGRLAFVCGDGVILYFDEIQPEGKKRMKAEDYLRGHEI